MKYNYKIFADYSQIFIEDSSVFGSYNVDWREEELNEMLSVHKNAIIIETSRNMVVPFSLEICDKKPYINIQEWDHINECGIEICSGILNVYGSTDYKEEYNKISIEPGFYGVLVCYGGLSTISEDGLSGEDRYKVFLWNESSNIGKTVIKQYEIRN